MTGDDWWWLVMVSDDGEWSWWVLMTIVKRRWWWWWWWWWWRPWWWSLWSWRSLEMMMTGDDWWWLVMPGNGEWRWRVVMVSLDDNSETYHHHHHHHDNDDTDCCDDGDGWVIIVSDNGLLSCIMLGAFLNMSSHILWFRLGNSANSSRSVKFSGSRFPEVLTPIYRSFTAHFDHKPILTDWSYIMCCQCIAFQTLWVAGWLASGSSAH